MDAPRSDISRLIRSSSARSASVKATRSAFLGGKPAARVARLIQRRFRRRRGPEIAGQSHADQAHGDQPQAVADQAHGRGDPAAEHDGQEPEAALACQAPQPARCGARL